MDGGTVIDELRPRYPVAISEPTGIEAPAVAAAHEVNATMAALAGQLNAVNVQLVDTIANALQSGVWAQAGVRSPSHWLTWQLGVHRGEADRLVQLAKARDSHPVVTEIFGEGRLSVTQAAIATSVEPERDAEIAELVVNCTIPQLRTYARAMRQADERPAPRPPQDKPDHPLEQPPKTESFDWVCSPDGWMDGRFRLDPEHAQEMKAALLAERDRLFHRRDEAADPDRDGRIAGVRTRWVDALVELVRRAASAEDSGSRRDRYRINLFLDPADDQTLRWGDRGGVPDWLAGKITCDGTISPVFVNQGKPTAVGRTQRIVPERTRRLVLYRDHHKCRIPWCERTRWLDVHHLIHWSNGGPTDPENLIAVCDHCHDAIHRSNLHIAGNADEPDGLTFTDRHGRIVDHTPRPTPPNGPPPEPAKQYIHPLAERIRRHDVHINPPGWKRRAS